MGTGFLTTPLTTPRAFLSSSRNQLLLPSSFWLIYAFHLSLVCFIYSSYQTFLYKDEQENETNEIQSCQMVV